MPSPSKLAHVVWRTADVERMVSWYCTVLGAKVVFQSPELAFITYDDEHHRVAFVNEASEAEPDRSARGLHHVAFTYDALDDLLAVYDELRNDEIVPYWTINHGPTTSFYYHDPDGNSIELQIDNYPDPQVLGNWFRTGAFMQNPIGVEFDPDDLLARRRDGEPATRLVHRSDTPDDFVAANS